MACRVHYWIADVRCREQFDLLNANAHTFARQVSVSAGTAMREHNKCLH